VTIYRRGLSFFLYYRENGKSVRRRVEGNLAVARATPTKVAGALDEERPSPIGFRKVDPATLVSEFVAYTANVQNLALRSQDRYRAALERFVEFAQERGIKSIDHVGAATVEDFVAWLRTRTRARNGHENAKKSGYKTGGIQFILSTCRTTFNWAAKRRMVPPYAENPFSDFPIDQMRDRDRDAGWSTMLSNTEQQAFFAACDDWQRRVFSVLVMFGLRVGEVTHLLIEDVDLQAMTIQIRSKPDLFWWVKTDRHRVIPLFPECRYIFEAAIAGRKAGFVFLNREYAGTRRKTAMEFTTPSGFRERVRAIAEELRAANPAVSPRELARMVTQFCRSMGQTPERRIRSQFMQLTRRIGRPDLTKAHDLRHLFSSRVQEQGMNPLIAQELLGHRSLEMTRRYTHLSLDAKRQALRTITSTYLTNVIASREESDPDGGAAVARG